MSIASKTCFKCGADKPPDSFYKHPGMADGRVNKCKECNKMDVRENRRKNHDYYIKYDKSRANLPHRVKGRKAYAQSDAGKASAAKGKQRWAERNPRKRKASHAVNNAVRDGRLHKPACCSCCNATADRLHGHHDDYAKPLDVRWLCAQCHRDWHKEHGEGANP